MASDWRPSRPDTRGLRPVLTDLTKSVSSSWYASAKRESQWVVRSCVLPARVMDRHFLKSYVDLLIETCHRRGIHAMGGMAAQIPIKNDEAANADAFAKVKADKEREATYGHDGTWVAHPGLVPVAKEVFDRLMPARNQIAAKKRDDVRVTAADLIHWEPERPITERGLRLNISVAIQYIGAWLAGQGAVPIFNLMPMRMSAPISKLPFRSKPSTSPTSDI